jgi:hypothetical protein
MKRRQTFALGALAVVAMSLVFMLYIRPDFMVQLSNQIWACF